MITGLSPKATNLRGSSVRIVQETPTSLELLCSGRFMDDLAQFLDQSISETNALLF
jgi:hypothetical protein